MNILSGIQKKIFDGSSEDIASAIKKVSFDTHEFQIALRNLKSISQLPQHKKNLRPDDISSSLGFKVTNFDGMKIYNGSKRGLKLYFDVVKDDEADIILIFSFGEFQPGRIICQFEAAIL